MTAKDLKNVVRHGVQLNCFVSIDLLCNPHSSVESVFHLGIFRCLDQSSCMSLIVASFGTMTTA